MKAGEAVAVELPASPKAKEVIAALHELMCDAYDTLRTIFESNGRMAAAAKALGHNPPALPVNFDSKQRLLVRVDMNGTIIKESEFDKASTAAHLGQPDHTIAFFSQPPYDNDPQYQWSVEEAKAGGR